MTTKVKGRINSRKKQAKQQNTTEQTTTAKTSSEAADQPKNAPSHTPEQNLQPTAATNAAVGEDEQRRPPTSEVSASDPSVGLQSRLDECVWKHGPKLKLAADYITKLAEFQLFPDMVSDEMFDLAVQRYKDRIARNLTADQLHWGPPIQEENGVGTMHVWRTQCGQYKVARFAGAEPRFAVSSRIDASNASETIIANDLRSLRSAFEFVEKFVHRQIGGKSVESNAESRIIEAEQKGIDKRPTATPSNQVEAGCVGVQRPTQQNPSPSPASDGILVSKVCEHADQAIVEYTTNPEITLTKGEDVLMKTTLKAIHKMLVASGLAKKETVNENWPLDRVKRKLKTKEAFDQLIIKSKSNPEGADGKLLDEIGKALTDGGTVSLAEDKGKPDKKASAEKKEPSEKKTNKKTKPSKNGAPRKRSGTSLIDAAFQVLTEKKKPMSPVDMIEIIEKKELWKRAGKTPEQSLASRIYVEMSKLGKKARFKKGEEKGTFALK